MAKEKTLRVSALNIILHPHSPERYVSILRTTRRNKITTRYRGDRHAMIGYLSQSGPDDATGAIEGQIYTYSQIDPNEPWLDMETGKQADQEDLDAVSLPEHLKPSLRRYNFVFFPKKHRLFFESYSHEGHSLGPTSAQKIFENLLNHDSLAEKFGQAEVVLVPTHEALDRILSMPQLSTLTIFINRPNADDVDDVEDEVMRRLEEMDAQSHTEAFKAGPGKSVKPDRRARAMADVGSSNGYVEGKGIGPQGKAVTESTRDHPLREPVTYDPSVEQPTGVLRRAAEKLLNSIKASR